MDNVFDISFDVLTWAINVMFFAQAVIVFVSCLATILFYRTKQDVQYRHVFALMLAMMLFNGLTVSGYFLGRYDFWTWRGAVIFAAFVLTDYALIPLLVPHLNNRAASQVNKR